MHASYTDASIRDVNSAFSPDQSVLNCCSTATRFQCRGRKSSPSFVWYTNRPFWQQRRCTKRLIIREDYGHEIDSTRPLVNPATHTHTHTSRLAVSTYGISRTVLSSDLLVVTLHSRCRRRRSWILYSASSLSHGSRLLGDAWCNSGRSFNYQTQIRSLNGAI